jgi:hypothetical protein
MKNSILKYLVDTFMFISMSGIIFIGILMAFFLAEGPVKNEAAKYFLGLHRHQWGHLHLYLSLAFTFFLILHLVLEWKWIKLTAAKLFKGAWKLTVIGTCLLAVLVLVLFWVWTPKYAESYSEFGRGQGKGMLNPAGALPHSDSLQQAGESEREGGLVLTGQMTLQDIEKITGISAERIIESMHWSSQTRTDITLGWLKRQIGFDMITFRDRIYSLMDERQAGPVESMEPVHESGGVKEDLTEKEDNSLPEAEEHDEKAVRGMGAEDQFGLVITGRMTFRDIQKETGVDLDVLFRRMGLPPSTSQDEGIGRLRRTYGFSIPKLRETLAELMEKK